MKRRPLSFEQLEDRLAPAAAPFAASAWMPLLGDWNGDHKDTVGTFDPRTATWYLRNENTPGAADVVAPFPYGAPGWIPVVGDWTGSGKDGIGVFDPNTATWYLKNTPGPGAPDIAPFQYGAPGWRPVAGDWNGDGKTTVGAVDPATATWYLRNANSVGPPDQAAPFGYGGFGWFYLAGSFSGDPHTGIATVDPATATWYLRNETSAGAPDAAAPFAYGAGGISPDQLFTGDHGPGADNPSQLQAGDVVAILQRAAAATRGDDAIVAVVDRGGRVLGVRVEGNVAPQITGDFATLTFAVDGALAEARTAAFFANDTAPLTSRTVQFISQSTVTQREVDSLPSVTDPSSPLRGPGLVAPVGLGGHFPPNIAFTPSADLFEIELTNRDSIVNPGPDHIKGTADDVLLPSRFNVPAQFLPAGAALTPPESYGLVSGILPLAQARGIGTLPGGIPIYKNGVLVGGIGVFFPGTTGTATEENSSLSATHDPNRPDRSVEAEFVAFAAVGGSIQAGYRYGLLGGVDVPAGLDIPFGRIDLSGITLDIIGPGGTQGPENLNNAAQAFGIGQGNPNSGDNFEVNAGADGRPGTGDDILFRNGQPVADGWLVTPHDGVGISAADVQQLVQQGINTANQARAQIRLPLGNRTRMVFAVADSTGQVLGLYRMSDATVFSIDVAVAKARNVAYYDDPAQLVSVDRVPGVAPGVAFTNRTFRYVAQPRFPEGIDGKPPGPFSILNDPGGAVPAAAFQSVLGYAAFNPNTNFHAPTDPRNQNGVVFFPGSSGVYRNGQTIVGGFGVSGDGVDQDDVVTAGGINGFAPSANLRADQAFVNGVRLPYQNFPRNPFD